METFELTTTQATVCKLISAAMFHTPEIIAADVDWQAVYEEMRAQTIQGLVMDILPELPCPDDLKKLWRSECFQMVKNGIRLRYEQAEFLSILEKQEIPYVVLKGTAAAMYYPNPMLRGMGDVDVYVPYRYHAELTRMLTENGYAQLKDKEDYVRHREFEKNAVEFEVHRAYAFVNSKKEKEYIDGLLEKCCSGEVKADRAEQGATVFYFPPKDINGIVLLEHIGHHLYSGLGFRQIIDWMMYVSTSLGDAEWEHFQPMAKRAGLETLAKTVTKMCVKYLGLEPKFEWCMDADDALADEVLSFLFENGNFGRKMRHENIVVKTENRYRKSGNIFATLQETGEFTWKLYKKHRWLKPFAGLYQIGRYTRKVVTNPEVIKIFRKGMAEGKKRFEVLERLGIVNNDGASDGE